MLSFWLGLTFNSSIFHISTMSEVNCNAHWGLMPRTSSHTFMKVKRSTLVGMTASWAFVKWNSELARVFKAEFKIGGYNSKSSPRGKWLTFAALVLCDVVLALQVVEGEDVLHLSVCVDDWALSVLLTGFNLLDEEVLDVVWLLVGEKSGQILTTVKHSDSNNQSEWKSTQWWDCILVC